MNIKIAGTVNDSIVDGPGIRYTIFVQGCPHRCRECQNPQTHDFNGGKIADTSDIAAKILKNPLLDGVTFSGGEPFCQAYALCDIAERLKFFGLNIVTYTGYTFEYLISHSDEKNGFMKLLEFTDLLIDGPFVYEQKSIELDFRGSRNQRLIDCKKSLESGVVTEYILDNLH